MGQRFQKRKPGKELRDELTIQHVISASTRKFMFTFDFYLETKFNGKTQVSGCTCMFEQRGIDTA